MTYAELRAITNRDELMLALKRMTKPQALALLKEAPAPEQRLPVDSWICAYLAEYLVSAVEETP